MGASAFIDWRRLVSISLSLTLLSASMLSIPAKASTVIFQTLGRDNNEPPADLRFDHETRNMAIKVFDNNRDIIVVSLTFASNVSSTTFSASSTILRVKFMPSLTNFRGNAGNIWIEAPKVAYQGSIKIPAVASSYVSDKSSPNDPRKNMSSCGALTWMDDVPGRNMVSFEFSRNCFDLPDTFWAVSQVETDIFNNATIRDVRFTPVEPFYIDMNSVPKPPKVIPKRDQTISGSTAQREYFVDNSAIQIIASSSGGAPLIYNSRTPEICFVTSTGLIQPKSAGSCQVAIDAAGSLTLNPAPTVLITVSLVKKSQTLYFNPPDTVYMSQSFLRLSISSEFNLPVLVVSTAPTICSFPYPSDPTGVDLLRPGNCSFKVTQAGNFIYNPREGFASFEIYADPVTKPTPRATQKPTPRATAKSTPRATQKPAPKPTPTVTIIGEAEARGDGTGSGELKPGGSSQGIRTIITCVKGKTSLKVGPLVNPKCPSGYTKK